MAMTKTDTANYRGQLFTTGAVETGFLRLIGNDFDPMTGLVSGAGTRARRVGAKQFATSVNYTPDAGAIPNLAEDDVVSSLTPTTKTATQTFNTVQLFQEVVGVSWFAGSQATGIASGINVNEPIVGVTSLAQQAAWHLQQMAIDMDYTFINGTYQADSTTATAAKTRGLLSAISTNSVNASSTAISQELIDELLVDMDGNGAQMQDMYLIADANQIMKINNIYGVAPRDRMVGGTGITQIVTPLGNILNIYRVRNMPTTSVAIIDRSVIRPVFLPITPEVLMATGTTDLSGVQFGDITWAKIGRAGASEQGFWYSQAGLDYGPEVYHGEITSLTA